MKHTITEAVRWVFLAFWLAVAAVVLVPVVAGIWLFEVISGDRDQAE